MRLGVSCGVGAGANALSNITSKPSQQAKESLALESPILCKPSVGSELERLDELCAYVIEAKARLQGLNQRVGRQAVVDTRQNAISRSYRYN